MNPKAEELKARTKRFALKAIAFVSTLPRTTAGDVMGRQLLKSGTAVAANYRSACRSRSHQEFVARIGVVLEEADESERWLELLAESRVAPSQLRAIFAGRKSHSTPLSVVS